KGPNTKRQKPGRDMQRRTRRSASTIGGAAPDTIIGRAAADRAGARPYRATRCENASKCATPDRAGGGMPLILKVAIFSMSMFVAGCLGSTVLSDQKRGLRRKAVEITPE